MQKILVTGSNGFLGRGIVNELIKNDGVQVISTDFSVEKSDKSNLITKECDIFTFENPFQELNQPDILLHLAWRDGFKHNSDVHIDDLAKHYHFIERMINSGVKKVCVMGSMHEVGFHEGSINENTPCNPLSLYGIAKNALRESVEILCKTKGVDFQWLRGYYIVENTSKGCSIFSKIMQSAADGKKEFPFTTGINQYDFLNYEDFCYQVTKAILNNDILGIINICSGKPEKLCDRVERFIKENDLDIKLDYGKFPDRPYDSLAVWGNPEKIQKILKN